MVFAVNTGQGIASLILVLVPTESVPPQFRATSIGLATLVGEIMGSAVPHSWRAHWQKNTASR
jgi:hypothetical protein